MKFRYRALVIALAAAAVAFALRMLVGGSTVTLFSPAGPTAAAQRTLILEEVSLMLLVAVPMFAFLFYVVWKYGDGRSDRSDYDAEWHGGKSQLIMWAIPVALIVILGTINWRAAFALDPGRPILSPAAPIEVDVVALEWKWLFIYPEQGMASVNELVFPAGTPVHFYLTADAPMSSFWIPQLGSQIYAMDGMVTQLNLMASTTGEYLGKDTEINGPGYAGMTFDARSVTALQFASWVAAAKGSSSTLTLGSYEDLAKPSSYVPPSYYSSVDAGLYGYIVAKFMMPSSSVQAPGAYTNVIQAIPAMKGAKM